MAAVPAAPPLVPALAGLVEPPVPAAAIPVTAGFAPPPLPAAAAPAAFVAGALAPAPAALVELVLAVLPLLPATCEDGCAVAGVSGSSVSLAAACGFAEQPMP